MPKYGKIVEFQDGAFRYGDEIKLRERTVTVAGTTSQVMDQVLSDREILGKQGVVLVVLTEQAGIFDIANMSVEERGLGLTTPEERQQLRVILQDCVREVLAGNGNSANKKESADKSALGRDNLVKQLKQAIRKRIKQESDREPLVVVMLMGL
jgi:mRNA degradation ribonuclease J1/J2